MWHEARKQQLGCNERLGNHICAYLNMHTGSHQCACSTDIRWNDNSSLEDMLSLLSTEELEAMLATSSV